MDAKRDYRAATASEARNGKRVATSISQQAGKPMAAWSRAIATQFQAKDTLGRLSAHCYQTLSLVAVMMGFSITPEGLDTAG